MLVISFLIFMFIHLIPGDPARLIAGMDATKQEVETIRRQLGLDKPLMAQYFIYMKGIFHGDLGYSIKNNAPVASVILPRFKPTIILTICSMIWATILGVFLGIIAAVRRGKPLDYLAMIIAISGISVPGFWLGLMLIILFSLKLHWLPSGGKNGFSSLILPALTVGFGLAALITRTTRSSMLDVIRQDYMTTARAKGCSERRVIFRHGLKNALIPIITAIGLQMSLVITGSVLAETVFSWPGIGSYAVQCILKSDYPVVEGFVLLVGVIYVVINLVVDIIYARLDPRISYAKEEG